MINYELIHYIEMSGGIAPHTLLPSELENISYPTFPFRSNRKSSAKTGSFTISEEDKIIIIVLTTMFVVGALIYLVSQMNRRIKDLEKLKQQKIVRNDGK